MKICVFCGSRTGRAVYVQAAREFGHTLVDRGHSLVYGGGRVGLMGVIAQAVLERGGHATGVIPRFLNTREVAHTGLSELLVVETMHERKALMEARAEAFVAMPGGFGTYEEILEIITWGQLGLHRKPIALFNLNGFYEPLMAQVERGVREEFIAPELRDLLLVESTGEALITALEGFSPPAFERFLDRDHS